MYKTNVQIQSAQKIIKNILTKEEMNPICGAVPKIHFPPTIVTAGEVGEGVKGSRGGVKSLSG